MEAVKGVSRSPRSDIKRKSELAVWGQVVAVISGYVSILVLAHWCNRWLFSDHSTSTEQTAFTRWDYIGTSTSVAVDTYVRKVAGTKLLAFRGAVVLKGHIAEVLNAYADVEATTEWADLLKIMETRPVAISDSHNASVSSTGNGTKSLFGGLFGKLKSFTGRKGTANIQQTGNNIFADNPFRPTLSDLVYQYYQLPWPVAPRDFLFKRTIQLFPSERSATIRFVSTLDSRYPPINSTSSKPTVVKGRTLSRSTIRAESPFTNWLFQDLDAYCNEVRTYDESGIHGTAAAAQTTVTTGSAQRGTWFTKEPRTQLNPHRDSYYHDSRAHAWTACAERRNAGLGSERGQRRTYVEIEALVDNKGSLPAWFVNYVQRSWPSATLNAFATRVRKQQPEDTQDSGEDVRIRSGRYTGALKEIAKW